MAVSPLIPRSPAGATTTTTAAKSKTLAVRSSLSEASQGDVAAKADSEPDLAEKLNEEARRRYVKGRRTHPGPTSLRYGTDARV